ncbi:MAG: hypothetical protein F6K19_44660 [Cyanothece sp. SIO1E1]|nr:hypothetical protein [Cyanothece sp. SIO1E1]
MDSMCVGCDVGAIAAFPGHGDRPPQSLFAAVASTPSIAVVAAVTTVVAVVLGLQFS